MDQEKIKVRISVQVLNYHDQEHLIDKEEFDEFKKLAEAKNHKEADKLAARIADTYIDYSSIQDTDPTEGSVVEIDEVKE